MSSEVHPYSLSRAEVYDIEIYFNLFTYSSLDQSGKKRVYEISERKNQLFGLLQHLKNKPLLVGFNSSQYDNTILHYLLSREKYLLSLSSASICKLLYELSKAIINFDKQDDDVRKAVGKLRFQEHFPWIDLLEVIREGYSVKGLKAVGINLNHHRIQDLPYPFDHIVQKNEIDEILEYNLNDVVITQKILDQVNPRLEMRQVLSKKNDLHVYSDSDSRMAKTMLNKRYAEKSGKSLQSFQNLRTKRTKLCMTDVIFSWVKFKTPQLQEYLQELKKLWITDIENQGKCDIPTLFFNGMEYTVALGGIHSVDKPGIFEATEDLLLWDLDVGSYHPTAIINNRICPAHLDADIFIPLVEEEVIDRLKNKKLGKHGDYLAGISAEGQKIEINAIFGCFNYKGYWLYDALCTYQVTMNNQLALLMLIEDLNLAGIDIITANTDGIILFTDKKNTDIVNNIRKEWEDYTGFVLEDTFYSKYIRRDINNFLSIKTDGECKVKGIFIPQGGILKGYDKPIIAIALRNYFVDSIPIEQTIRNIGTPYVFSNLLVKGENRVTDIFCYMMAQKVGSTFDRAECHYPNGTQKVMQRSLRYYASNTGVELFKVKNIEEKVLPTGEVKPACTQYNTLLASSPVTVFNDYVEGPYDINFKYYIEETNRIICAIEGKIYLDKEELQQKLAKLLPLIDKRYALNEKYQTKYATCPVEKLPKVYHSTLASYMEVQEQTLFILNQLVLCSQSSLLSSSSV